MLQNWLNENETEEKEYEVCVTAISTFDTTA